ncbi:MAG: peptidase T [Erysipelotrichaceae bacterium]
MNVIERFLNYVAMDTQSDETTGEAPSTKKQWDLANLLLEELTAMGLESHVSAYGVVYGKLKGDPSKPALGLIAHMDTSPDASGKDVKPRIIKGYDGSDIALNAELMMRVAQFPSLNKQVGNDLIVTDGTTLLGADDKAGIAIIMEVCSYFVQHPEEHGDLYVAFTPDEEIGAGTAHFDLEAMPVAFAYTVDGSASHIIDYETFNAADAKIEIAGSSIHPGAAKQKMINALLVGMELESMLPQFDKPQHTEGKEGFYHLVNMSGACEHASMRYILRHHDKEAFEAQKTLLQQAVAFLNQKYGQRITCTISDSYENMLNYLQTDMTCVDLALASMKKLGIEPEIGSIRGGTDGARLSAMGLLTPNLGTGGYQFHGPFEYLSIQECYQSIEIIKQIIKDA